MVVLSVEKSNVWIDKNSDNMKTFVLLFYSR